MFYNIYFMIYDLKYNVVIQFSVDATPFLYDKTEEYIQEHFGHKIQW